MSYLISFGAGLSVVPTVVASEIYPLRVRAVGMSQVMIAQWLANALVAATFLSLADALTIGGVFAITAAITGLGGLCIYRYLPETAGVPLEHVERVFDDPYPRVVRKDRNGSIYGAQLKPTEVTSLKGGAGP